MSKIKILVIGGIHGNEYTGIELVKILNENPLENIESVIANPQAVNKDKRFIETDLNRSFGKTETMSLEEKLAKNLIQKIKKKPLILDFHNTTADYNSCAITTKKPTEEVLKICSHLELEHIIIMPPGNSLIGQCQNTAISVEISNNQGPKFSPNFFYQKLKTAISKKPDRKINTYRFVKKIPKPSNLDLSKINNFEELILVQKKLLNLDLSKKYYPIFKGEEAYQDTSFIIVKKIS